ncbi:MAG: 3-hydroxyacyl-ACP dehydratase FabZ family protein [Planctomycetia bacterium]|nr:3-hydroxyacyl-ACP dehydratase FabZ family protein [Planctomycetia bacterium]
MAEDAIYQSIPHREPFLFVDKILECTDSKIVCQKTFTGEEGFFQGHYPETPIVPGVILCEAAMQAGAIMLSRNMQKDGRVTIKNGTADAGGKVPVVVKMNDVRFRQIIEPGDTIQISVVTENSVPRAHKMSATVTKNNLLAVKLSFVVMIVENPREEN